MTVGVIWIFPRVTKIGLQCVTVVFPDHTHLLLNIYSIILNTIRSCHTCECYIENICPQNHNLVSPDLWIDDTELS